MRFPSRDLLAAVFVLTVCGILTFTQVVSLRTDMAEFLPSGGTPASRLLLRQLQSGAAASLLLVGIENAAPEELARISRGMATRLETDPDFVFVSNGAQGFGGGEEAFLFSHRYLMSPATNASAFTTEALHARLEQILIDLAGASGVLVKRYAFADPVGAFLALARNWIGDAEIEMQDGVWMARDGKRAILLARAKAASLDLEAQRHAIDAAEMAFAETAPASARLLVSGPGVFAVRSADAIKADVRLVSILSTAALVAFLWWRYRSPNVLLAVAVPLAAGTISAALLVQLVFGSVHGITLGFGMTMLGVAVDYPLLLLGQRRPGEPARETAARIGPTLGLAVGAAALGLTVMLLSSFPGLSQLGLFSATGLLVAAATTRCILPRLVSDVESRDQTVGPALSYAAALLRRRRGVLLLIVAAAAVKLIAMPPRFETDLANLGPIPAADRAMDEELRREVGAPDVRHLVTIRGADAEAVLLASERLEPAIEKLRSAGAITRAELPSRLLPSVATQLARRAILPPADKLEADLAAAQADLPFKPGAFDAFVADVARERAGPAIERTSIVAPGLAARLDPILGQSADGWFGLAALIGVANSSAVAQTIAALADPALSYIDIKAETEGMLAGYLSETVRWLIAGGVVLLLVLVLGLRQVGAIAKVIAPTMGALILTLALLSSLDVHLTMFHLAALLLMIGVSVDYGLFLSRPADAADSGRVLGSILNCNAATLLTFGLLVFCTNPVLRGIGVTVATGVLSSIVLAVAWSRGETPSAAA